jgi:hypothetical protein
MSTTIYIYSQDQQISMSPPPPVTGTLPRVVAAVLLLTIQGCSIHLQLPNQASTEQITA